ncbi:peptidase inhibitor family I36 protein [Streptomyces jumonjinensis]|nr:peptidase inhibitor family I36 protein [Streptomyces jumonjinensis]
MLFFGKSGELASSRHDQQELSILLGQPAHRRGPPRAHPGVLDAHPARAFVSGGGAVVALLTGGMVAAPTAPAVPSECPRSVAHPVEDPALCLFDENGFEGRMLKFREYGCQNLGSTWGFDGRADSYIDNTYHRVVLYYGANSTGTSIAAGARSVSSDLGNASNKISSMRILR